MNLIGRRARLLCDLAAVDRSGYNSKEGVPTYIPTNAQGVIRGVSGEGNDMTLSIDWERSRVHIAGVMNIPRACVAILDEGVEDEERRKKRRKWRRYYMGPQTHRGGD